MTRHPVQYLHGILAGVGFAAFLGIMGATSSVPCPDNLAVGCFAVSIPLNAFTFICVTDFISDYRLRSLRCIFRFAGLFVGYAGLAFSFGHFGWRYLLLFSIVVLIAHGSLVAIARVHRLGVLLPKITVFTLSFHWWPYLFAGVAVLLALTSMGFQWLNSHFYHFIIMLLVVESFILLMEQLIFALPVASVMTFR